MSEDGRMQLMVEREVSGGVSIPVVLLQVLSWLRKAAEQEIHRAVKQDMQFVMGNLIRGPQCC